MSCDPRISTVGLFRVGSRDCFGAHRATRRSEGMEFMKLPMTAIARYPSSLVSKIQSGESNGSLTDEACIGATKSGSGFLGIVSSYRSRWLSTVHRLYRPRRTRALRGDVSL